MRIIYEHEVLRWGLRLKELYPERSAVEKSDAMRTYRDEVGRLASGYFFIMGSAIRDLRSATEQTEVVLRQIEDELGK